TLGVVNTSTKRLAFKYRSGDAGTLARDLTSLRDATFYAANRHTLNDPFEGRFDRTPLDSQFDAMRGLVSAITPTASASLDAVSAAANEVLEFVDKSGVFSLSYNPLQELIWAHYGGSHRGFCIGYDLERLVEFEPNVHHFLDVQYSNAAPALRPSDLIASESHVDVLKKMLGVKSKPWAYEEEVRVITVPPGLHEHDYRAVKVIYFGLRCPESTQSAVMEALAGRGVAYVQVISPPSSYALQTKKVADKYESAPRYKQNVAPISEGAICPDYLKPEQKQHADYLYKAVEIVRREPYCQEVIGVDFSGSESKPGKPIIYAHYLRAPNKYVKRLFTMPDIDRQYKSLDLPPNDV
ncbi:MAG TPA: DUF2971 domain-containing protein, partial [Methylibium sp.]|nr:DUF2971 domain-containing protein [Methylibium sp.]